MAEGMNVEIAHTLHAQFMEAKERQRPSEVLEFIEAILLAVVAVATAWSGYQAPGVGRLNGLSTHWRRTEVTVKRLSGTSMGTARSRALTTPTPGSFTPWSHHGLRFTPSPHVHLTLLTRY